MVVLVDARTKQKSVSSTLLGRFTCAVLPEPHLVVLDDRWAHEFDGVRRRLQRGGVGAESGPDVSPCSGVGVRRAGAGATTARPGQADAARGDRFRGRPGVAGSRGGRDRDAAGRGHYQEAGNDLAGPDRHGHRGAGRTRGPDRRSTRRCPWNTSTNAHSSVLAGLATVFPPGTPTSPSTPVHTAESLDTPQARSAHRGGGWSSISPLSPGAVRCRGPRFPWRTKSGRVFDVDPRTGYDWSSAPTGVRWRVQAPFEVPRTRCEARRWCSAGTRTTTGATDLARIDLGIEARRRRRTLGHPAGDRTFPGPDGDTVNAWLRRNRWGLLALPVTMALAVGANAQRLHDYLVGPGPPARGGDG